MGTIMPPSHRDVKRITDNIGDFTTFLGLICKFQYFGSNNELWRLISYLSMWPWVGCVDNEFSTYSGYPTQAPGFSQCSQA
jgi:hypothetical protein